MMKKIYLFFAMLLGLFGSTAMVAQEKEHKFDKLTTICIGPAVGSIETETWYFMYQGRDSSQGSGDYMPKTLGELIDISTDKGGVLADPGKGKDMIKKSVEDVFVADPENDPGVSALAYKGYVVRFHAVSGADGAYTVEFGTGTYMSDPVNGKFTTVDNIYDAGQFNIYTIDDNNPGPVGFNVYDMKERIDNNGTGYTVVTWGTGKQTATSGSNSIWSIHEVIWGESDELNAAVEELLATYGGYENYVNTLPDMVGTYPGQYSKASVDAFVALMEKVMNFLEGEGEDVTVESCESYNQQLKDAYQAVLDSKVPFTLTDGYYRIRSGMAYSNDVETGELDGEGNPIKENRQVYKYLFTKINGTTINARWETPADLSTDCPSLWQITNKDGYYDIVSMATDARFNNVAMSTQVTLSTESTNLMALENIGTSTEGEAYLNIRVSSQASGDYFYLHQNNHGGGTGVASNVVGWCSTYATGPAASEWVLEPVDEAEAAAIIKAYEPIKNHDVMVENYRTMLADAKAKLVIAKDIQKDIDMENPLVTAANLSSPCSDAEEGQHIEYLVDNDASTFWHSDWHGAYTNEPHHYMQIEFVEDVPTSAIFQFTRRDNSGNQITKWSVYGLDDNNFELKQEDAELLATVETPFKSQTETLTSDIFETKGHKYLRFYCEATSSSSNSKFFHLAEFQVYSATVLDPVTSQYHVMGALATNLETVIESQAEIDLANLTLEQFNALKTPYDAFIAKFVDPSDLRAAITSAEEKTKMVIIGTQPGYWAGESGAGALAKTVADAKAYDKAGNYTQANSDAYIEALNSQAGDVLASANTIKTGKWYRIRFGTEEEYEAGGWDKVAGNAQTVEKDGSEYTTNPALFGKYVSVAKVVSDSPVEGVTCNEVEAMTNVNEAVLGSHLYFDELENISKDFGLFRFVSVGDSAYVLQNKASNLYLKAAGTSGQVSLSIHPSLFNVRAIGYGQNAISSKSITGVKQSNLHAQVAQNTLVTWDVDYPGSRSGLYIEEVEDVAPTYEGKNFHYTQQTGTISALCYPMSVSAVEGIYGVNAAKVENGNVALTLVPLTEVEAGRPFIVIAGDTEDFDSENAEQTTLIFQHGNDIVKEPVDGPYLKGVFSETEVGGGVIVPSLNTFEVTKKSSTTVAANKAYIAEDDKYNYEATVSFVIDDKGEDSIASVLTKVAKSGEIYTLDGRLITRNGNLNTLKRLGKGVYILNGAKVTIK